MKKELDDKLYDSIVSDIEKGDNAVEKVHNATALKYYLSALNKIPESKTDWEIALHVYTALGDLFMNMEEYENAQIHYNLALRCPDGITNGYVWLGQGQSYYELNDMEKAKDSLMRAFMLEGDEMFVDCDEKYFNLIRDFI